MNKKKNETVKSRPSASRPGTFRPAAAVAADLIRAATPRRQRVPRRPVPGVELHEVRVLTVRHTAGSPVATVAVNQSDAIRITVAAREFTCRGKRKADADAMLPITMTDDGPVLAVQLDALPNGLTPGAVVRILRVGFGIEASGDIPAVLAIAEKVTLFEVEPVAAPVTLWPVTLDPPPPIEGVNDDPVQQAKFERWYRCVLAAQSRQAAWWPTTHMSWIGRSCGSCSASSLADPPQILATRTESG